MLFKENIPLVAFLLLQTRFREMENNAKRKQTSSQKSRPAPKRAKGEVSGGSAQVAPKRPIYFDTDSDEEA